MGQLTFMSKTFDYNNSTLEFDFKKQIAVYEVGFSSIALGFAKPTGIKEFVVNTTSTLAGKNTKVKVTLNVSITDGDGNGTQGLSGGKFGNTGLIRKHNFETTP